MFSNTAGDAARPPGLLQGISALSPSANAAATKLHRGRSYVGCCVSAVAANGEIVFIASPKQAVTLRLRTFWFSLSGFVVSRTGRQDSDRVAANSIASRNRPDAEV